MTQQVIHEAHDIFINKIKIMKIFNYVKLLVLFFAIYGCSSNDQIDSKPKVEERYTVVEGYLTYGSYNYANNKKILVSMTGGLFSGGTIGEAITDANGYYKVSIPCRDYVGETRTICVNFQPPNGSYASELGYTNEFSLGSYLRVDLNYNL